MGVEGFDHLAITVADIEATVAYYRQSVYFRDPDGNLLEFLTIKG